MDRRAAIDCAILDAREGDVVLVAGKGHELGQIVDRASCRSMTQPSPDERWTRGAPVAPALHDVHVADAAKCRD